MFKNQGLDENILAILSLLTLNLLAEVLKKLWGSSETGTPSVEKVNNTICCPGRLRT
jgi:hypothetical protein